MTSRITLTPEEDVAAGLRFQLLDMALAQGHPLADVLAWARQAEAFVLGEQARPAGVSIDVVADLLRPGARDPDTETASESGSELSDAQAGEAAPSGDNVATASPADPNPAGPQADVHPAVTPRDGSQVRAEPLQDDAAGAGAATNEFSYLDQQGKGVRKAPAVGRRAQSAISPKWPTGSAARRELIQSLADAGHSQKSAAETVGIKPGLLSFCATKYKIRFHGGRSGAPKGSKPQRRFEEHREPDPENVAPLADDHPAVTGARTVFPKSVVSAEESDRLLVSGKNSRKLGDRVSKGEWSGMPIYHLTLEERKTCPTSCHHWLTCYGNGMPFARRHEHGPDLEAKLAAELDGLQGEHPKGFVVRLHNLGDFYSVDYVGFWAGRLRSHPALHVFGYTAHDPRKSEIGLAIQRVNAVYRKRWFIRLSSETSQPGGATTIWRKPESDRVAEGIVCPAQTGKTACCGSCGLCWAPAARDETIVFIGHGNPKWGKKAKPADVKANVAAAAKLPKDAVSLIAAQNSTETADMLLAPVERRCAGCRKLFKTRIVAQARCRKCEAQGIWTAEDRRTLQECVTSGYWAREVVAALEGRYTEAEIYVEAKRLDLRWQGTKRQKHQPRRMVGEPKLPDDYRKGERA